MDPGALDPDGSLPISAYAKLEFEQFSFFIQTLTLLLGRKAKPGDNVDVHLGASKSISRNHAKIHYHFHASAWEIEVLGKNGAFVNERYVGAGETFPLHNEDKLQIAETPFTFLLPEGAAPPIDPAALAQADFDPLLSMPVETIMPSHTMNMEYMSDMLHPTTPLAPHDLMLDMHMEIPQLDDSLLLPPDQVALPLPPPELPQQALPPAQSQLDPVQPTPKKKPRKRAEKRQKEAAKPLQYIQPETAQPTFEGLSALLHADSAMQTQATGQAFVPAEPMQTNVTSGDLGAIQQTATPNEGVASLPDTAKPKKPRKKYTRKPKPDLATLPVVATPDALQTTAPVPVPVPVPVSTMQTQINEHTPMDLSADQVNLTGYPAGVNQDAFLQTLPSSQPMNMVDDSHIDHALLRLVPAHDDDLDGPGQQASIITQNGRTPAEQQAYNEALSRQQAIEEEGLVLPPEETDPQVIASFQRPTASYATLIYNAIVSHDHKKMTLAQIYNWICIHHPYYRYVVNGWQNSIRHNLSLNKAFMKVARTETEPGKGAFWAIDPEQEMLFENGVYKKKPPKPVVPPLSSRGNPIIMKDGKLALNPNFFVGPIQGKAEEAVKLLQEAIQKQLGENTTTEKAAQIAQALALALATQLKQADAGASKAKSSSPEPNDKPDKAASAKTTSEETDKSGKVDQDKDKTDKTDNVDKTKPTQPKTNGTETSQQASEKPKPKPAVSRPAAASIRPPPVKNTGRLLNGHPVAMPVSGPSVDERQRQAALHKAALEKAAKEKAALAGTAAVAPQQQGSGPSQSPRTSASPAPSTTLPNGTVAARSASPALARQPDASNEMKSAPQPVKSQPQPVSSVPVPGRPPYQALPGRPVQLAPQQNGRPAQVASTLQGAQTPLLGRPVQGPSTLKHAAVALPVARSGGRSGADLSTPVIVQSTPSLPNRLRSASPVKKTAPSKAQVERAPSPVRPMKRAADEQPVGSAATKTART